MDLDTHFDDNVPGVLEGGAVGAAPAPVPLPVCPAGPFDMQDYLQEVGIVHCP